MGFRIQRITIEFNVVLHFTPVHKFCAYVNISDEYN